MVATKEQIPLQGNHNDWGNIWNNIISGSTEDTSRHFSMDAPKTLPEFWQRAYFDDLQRFIKDRGFRDFLELGSGRGTTSMYLAGNGAENITMVDLSQDAFQLAKRNFKENRLQVPRMVLADVQDTGLESARYDCIYNIGLLEHFEDPYFTLKEAYRLLRPGGLIFMPIVPDLPFYKSFFQRLFLSPVGILKYLLRKSIRYQSPKPNPILRTRLAKKQYVEIAKRAGFSGAQCLAYNPYCRVNTSRWFENTITLRLYHAHYRIRGGASVFHLSTSSLFEFCYLLVGFKAEK